MSRKPRNRANDPLGLVHSVASVRATADWERDRVRVQLSGLMLFLKVEPALRLARQIIEAADHIDRRGGGLNAERSEHSA